VVVVTGASSGLGYETAKILAASGYRVIGAARRVEKLGGLVAEIEAAGGTAAACYLDVTDEAAYETLFKFAEACYGGVDHVFLNAGQSGLMKGPGNMEGHEDTDAYRNLIKINVTGSVVGMKHAIRALRKRGGGSITTVSSNGGGFSRGGFAGALDDITHFAPFCLTSAALDQLARVGTYYNTENIRCYGLKVGVYASEMVDGWVDHYKENIDKETSDDSIAGFNFFFSEMTGDPKHVGHIYETLVNNTTKYPPGSNILADNDATYDSSLLYQVADTDDVWPEVTLDTLRGYDGGEYTPQEDRTAAFIESLNAAEA
jgi:NAD(P)-dependent dehydrogenase (short-subunit alcohol dehydrogenase family)